MDEALEWARRCPDPMPGEEAVIEVRPIFEVEDFGEQFTPELRAQEDRLRAEVERRSEPQLVGDRLNQGASRWAARRPSAAASS